VVASMLSVTNWGSKQQKLIHSQFRRLEVSNQSRGARLKVLVGWASLQQSVLLCWACGPSFLPLPLPRDGHSPSSSVQSLPLSSFPSAIRVTWITQGNLPT
jgi:hypothetical protein